MSNYTNENLINVPSSSVPAGTLAMKVGDNIFTAGNVIIGTNTSDATATAQDIIQGKTAYIATGKVTGTAVPGTDFYKCSYVNSNSWRGYKAILVGDHYEFQSNSTSGLTYGTTTIVPVQGSVYDSGATLKASLASAYLLLAHLDNSLICQDGHVMTGTGVDFQPGKFGQAADVSYQNYISTGLSTTSLQGAFTIDMWVKMLDAEQRCAIIAGTDDCYLGIDTFNGTWNAWAGNGSSWNILQADSSYGDDSGVGSISCTTDWTHLALVHSGTIWYLFVDGQIAVQKDRQGQIGTGQILRVGTWGEGGFRGDAFLVDQLRICDTAKWTAAFTPPTAPY